MKRTTKIRFKDNGERLSDFGEQFLVICPNCKNCATVIPKFKEAKYNKYVYITIDSVGLTCFTCGYSKRKENVNTYYLGDCDFYFQLPLWLEEKCKDETIWAYNYRHLNFLENYIKSDIKEQDNNYNKSYISRLPAWIKKGSNKEDILKVIKKLKEK
jgi:hypothetical protein